MDMFTTIATAGEMVLQEEASYCGRTGATRTYRVIFADRTFCHFADRPSIKHLRERQYPVPKNTPKTWKRVKNEE